MEVQMNSVLARFLPGHADTDVASERAHRERQQVTFPDLTWDHFHWEQQRRTGKAAAPIFARAEWLPERQRRGSRFNTPGQN